MTDLDAGRELDEKVARLVWPDPDDNKTPIWIGRTGYWGPNYSTDVAAAMTLLDMLAEQGWCWKVGRGYRDYSATLYEPLFGKGPAASGLMRVAPTLPLAICQVIVDALAAGKDGPHDR